MRPILACLLLALAIVSGAYAQSSTLENRALRVEVNQQSGRIRVTEKATGLTWEQPEGMQAAGTRITVRQAAGVDRTGTPIIISSKMLADARKVDGDRDCSARAWLGWDAANLYLSMEVTDDVQRFGPSQAAVWEHDSVEMWVGSRQITLGLSPQDAAAYLSGSQRLSGGRIAVKTRADGYSLEAVLPWSVVNPGMKPKVGDRVRFSLGVNDADSGTREGQIYWPLGWMHGQPATAAEAVLAGPDGAAPTVPARKDPVYRVLSQGERTLELERTYDVGAGKRLPLRLRFSLPDASAPDLRVTATAEDLKTPIGEFQFLEPFVLDAPQGVLAVADYGNGHLYPLDLHPFPRGSFAGHRLDMPWVGLCDMDTGRGYLLYLETSDDCTVRMTRVAGKNGRGLVAPTVSWYGQKNLLGYPRSLLFHFAPRGGYVALCKRYRQIAQAQGIVVPFTEKLKQNPDLKRLFGAPDIWGNASLRFAREAHAAGVTKMLINGKPGSPADMQAINDLGYLTSEYDNYTDILPTTDGKVTSNRAILPDHAVQQANGERMKAWLTFDNKTQFMKRCPSLWMSAAEATAERVLAEWPFKARFIDVTSAEGMYECYDPAHPLTRGEKRACGPELFKVFRKRKLVMGGEHGIWWAVPGLDYIEGMMSGGYTSWPAGHLIHPKTKEDSFTYPSGAKTGKWEAYEKWGIGHQWRAPLWELVFHDCIVSTWYWGDSSDYLLDAAPEITPKKDAFNILYGTIPLMWINNHGAWVKDRAVFLNTYRNTCKLHEVIATAEMLSHEYVTADGAVQRTRFSDGTTCVVNFGEKPQTVTLGRRTYLLPQNGWAVEGPRIAQSLALEGNTPVTAIRAPGYAFTDRGGVPVTMQTDGPGRLRIVVSGATKRATARPTDLIATWKPQGSLLYRLDDQSQTADILPLKVDANGRLDLGAVVKNDTFLLLWGEGARRPDIRVSSLQLSSGTVRQGERLRATATIANAGGAPARVPVEFLLGPTAMKRQAVDLKAGAKVVVTAEIDTSFADGKRTVAVAVDREGKLAELCEQNNRAEQSVFVSPDWARWPHRKTLRVDAGSIARVAEPAFVRFSLPTGADPASIRMAEVGADGQPGNPVPAQYDGDELNFILPGNLEAGASCRLMVLWRDSAPAGKATTVIPAGDSFWREDTQTILAPGYEAHFGAGTLTFLAPRKEGVTGTNFLRNLIVSSAETGWTEEAGTVEQFQVLHTGPVRTVIAVRKTLKAEVTYEKRYTFYPNRFDVEIAVNKPAGSLYSRAHYTAFGTYTDDKGLKAEVDGKGEGEDVSGKNRNPRWYAVYAPAWAHSCVALSPFDHNAYWDVGSAVGAIGFSTGRTKGIRLSYGIHAGAADASFAEADYKRLTIPVTVTWE